MLSIHSSQFVNEINRREPIFFLKYNRRSTVAILNLFKRLNLPSVTIGVRSLTEALAAETFSHIFSLFCNSIYLRDSNSSVRSIPTVLAHADSVRDNTPAGERKRLCVGNNTCECTTQKIWLPWFRTNPRYWLDPSTKPWDTRKKALKPTRLDKSRQRNIACGPRICEMKRKGGNDVRFFFIAVRNEARAICVHYTYVHALFDVQLNKKHITIYLPYKKWKYLSDVIARSKRNSKHVVFSRRCLFLFSLSARRWLSASVLHWCAWAWLLFINSWNGLIELCFYF